MFAGIVPFGLSHVLSDTDTPNNQVTSGTRNSLTSIAIAIYAVADR